MAVNKNLFIKLCRVVNTKKVRFLCFLKKRTLYSALFVTRHNSQAREATNNPSDALLSPCRGFGLLQNGFYRRLQLRNGLWPVRAVRPGVRGKNRQRCREENHPKDQAHWPRHPMTSAV